MIKNIRNTVKGGRFIRMYREGTRHYPSSTTCNDGTYFDAYLLPTGSGLDRKYPMFFNFPLFNFTAYGDCKYNLPSRKTHV